MHPQLSFYPPTHKPYEQSQVLHCPVSHLLLMEWWGHRGQCNTAGWLVRHLAYHPHYERRSAVRGADNGQNMCDEVEEEHQTCSVSVSVNNKDNFISQLNLLLSYLFLVVRENVCCISSCHHLVCQKTHCPNVSLAHITYNTGIT